VTTDVGCCRHSAQQLFCEDLHLVQTRHHASPGSCPESDDFRLISPVASLSATHSTPCFHSNTQHCRLPSCSKLCSRLERLRLTDGRTIIFVRFFEFPIVLVVRSGRSSRQTDSVACLAALRRMSRQLDYREPHQRPRAFGLGTGRAQESDTINLRPSVLLQPWRSAESIRGCGSTCIESARPPSEAAREGNPVNSRRRGNYCPGRSLGSLLGLSLIARVCLLPSAETAKTSRPVCLFAPGESAVLPNTDRSNRCPRERSRSLGRCLLGRCCPFRFVPQRRIRAVTPPAALSPEPGLLKRWFDGRTDFVASFLPLPPVGFVWRSCLFCDLEDFDFLHLEIQRTRENR
jgi:hypothetical protein